MNNHFRKAAAADADRIWAILSDGIASRKRDGSNQWQDGYPNPAIIKEDIDKGNGFVLTQNELVIGYCAILINDEPAYDGIQGTWLSNGNFVVFHRLAIAAAYSGKGLSKEILGNIEAFALSNNIHSIKADTNFDNIAMMKIFEQMKYVYCGEVYFRNSPRRAYEKLL